MEYWSAGFGVIGATIGLSGINGFSTTINRVQKGFHVMVALGLILLILGLIFSVHLLFIIGIVLLLVGIVLLFVRPGGRVWY